MGHEAGEARCDGGTGTLVMDFYREEPVLHPGPATVWFELRDVDGATLTGATQTVRIPR